MNDKKGITFFCLFFLFVIIVIIFICNLLQVDSRISAFLGGGAGVVVANLWRKYREK